MKLVYASLGCLMVVAAAVAADPPAPANGLPRPFLAGYTMEWKGMNAGTSELDLERRPDGRYLYVSRSNARGLFSLIFRNEILQSTVVEITAEGIRPLQYRGDDGSKKTDRDVSLDFDWTKGVVTGVAEDEAVSLKLSEIAHDPMSIQIALIHDLRAGRRPTAYRMVDKDEIKTYVYTYEGVQQLDTALGKLETIVYSSHREGSDRRVTRIWHAPSLEYVPVKAERLRDGKREWLMQIRSLKWKG